MSFRLAATLIIVLAASVGQPVLAQPASADTDSAGRLTGPKLFPEKTLAYVRIDDVQQLKADFDRSSFGKLGQDPQLEPILSEFYGSLVRNTAQMQEAIGLNLDELLSIPSGELAIALLPNDRESTASAADERDESTRQSRRGGPAFAMLLDAGDEISSVQIFLQRIEDQVDGQVIHEEKVVDRLTLHRYQNLERQQEQFAYFIDAGVIVACTDADYLEVLAGRWLGQSAGAKSLADNRKFTSIMSRCVGVEGERPQVSFYIDPLEIVRQFVPRNAATSFTLAMLPALGIDGIEAIGGSWIIAPPDFDAIAHFHLSLSSPRRGVLSLLRPKSGSTTPEDWVPDSVAAYSTINWDLASTLQAVERLFNQFRGPDALENEVFARVNDRLEIDLRQDVLDNLEGRITLLQGFVRPVRINSGSNVYAVRLKDVQRFKSSVLPRLVDRIEQNNQVKLESFGDLRVHVFEPGGDRTPEVPVRLPEVCITVIDDYIVVSDSRFMMRQLADCQMGTGGKLRESLEYQLISDRIAAQLQDKECSAISFSRPEESLQLFYELARDPQNRERLRQVADNNGFFKALLAALDKHELPPFSVIAKYLAPGGGFLLEEETGLHYMSFALRRE